MKIPTSSNCAWTLKAILSPLAKRFEYPCRETTSVKSWPCLAMPWSLRPEGQSIFIVDANNQAQQVRVTTGVGSGEHIEVLGAVSPGDRVVIRGNERLQPGQAVNIMDS